MKESVNLTSLEMHTIKNLKHLHTYMKKEEFNFSIWKTQTTSNNYIKKLKTFYFSHDYVSEGYKGLFLYTL